MTPAPDTASVVFEGYGKAMEKGEHGEAKGIAFSIPKPPVFQTVEEERLHRKQRLAAGFRIFARLGYAFSVAGHISCRDPELTDHYWVNPYSMHFSKIKVSDLILVNHRGEVVYGDKPVNAAGFAIHSALHQARPDVIGACHTHGMAGKTWSALGKLLEPISQDHCAYYERHSISKAAPLVEDTDEGARLAEELGPTNHAVILQNHGLLTVGKTIEEALWWYILGENLCESSLKAMAAVGGDDSKIVKLSHEVASHTRDIVGSPMFGWFAFNTYYQWICEEEPDFLL